MGRATHFSQRVCRAVSDESAAATAVPPSGPSWLELRTHDSAKEGDSGTDDAWGGRLSRFGGGQSRGCGCG